MVRSLQKRSKMIQKWSEYQWILMVQSLQKGSENHPKMIQKGSENQWILIVWSLQKGSKMIENDPKINGF